MILVISISFIIFNSLTYGSLFGNGNLFGYGNRGNPLGITDRLISVEENTPGSDSCYNTTNCNVNNKYRTIDGSCNNLRNPGWGSANGIYTRLLPAQYQDGVHEIRKAANGQDLPNVRKISSSIFPDIKINDRLNSLALMQWGQIVTHDGASTGFPVVLNCCPNGQFAQPAVEDCYPIMVPKDDPFYSKYNVECMGYTRVYTNTFLGCNLTPRQQFSFATQWLDLSLLYGSDEDSAKSIRELAGGRLKVEEANGEETLPITHERQDFCRITSSNQSCLNTGDVRVNQNPHLAVLTILFTREHNQLANELGKLNPKWDDEKLYQEARRINIAQAQHITYNEYLPHILGFRHRNGLKLSSLKDGYTEYNDKVKGGTITEFTNSAFRTFHSTVQGDLELVGSNNGQCPFLSAKLGDYWWTVGDLVISCFDKLVKGLMAQSARIFSNYMTVQQTHYYQKGNKDYGDDLESIDLMRGRDLGFSSYNHYRKVCGLSTFTSFSQLNSVMNPKNVRALQGFYQSINDIDLLVGIILENPVEPGMVGPLGQCIIAQQFARWKFGDRFYYEHKNQAGSLTVDQLKAVRKATFSSLMCSTSKIGKIQRNGFYNESPQNKIVSCDQIPKINLEAWKE